jgi:hypothetical protein
MRKRKAGRAGSKPAAARKRDGVKDLSARKARSVVGGLLPAVRQPGATPSKSELLTESISINYSKMTID